jgi:hypothetical protein
MIARLLRITAAIAMLAVALGAAANVWVVLRIRRLNPLPLDSQILLPRGRSVTGSVIDVSALDAPCLLLRYASEKCQFCKRDLPQFQKVEEISRGAHCRTIIIAPSPSLIPQPINAGQINIALIDLQSARHLPFLETPANVLTDKKGRIMWSRVGTVLDRDPPLVAAALRKHLRIQ